MNLSQSIIVLLSIKGIGKITVKKLLNEINNDHVDRKKLYSLITDKTKIDIDYVEFLEKIDESFRVIAECEENGIRIVNYKQPSFPKKLLSLSDMPVLLYYKGSIERLNLFPSIAIVGTREPSDYGRKITKLYANLIAKSDINIVSGLAKGIDGIAHESAVEAGAYTVAFLAQGLNTKIYPSENRELAEKILLNNGALISEYKPNLRPSRNFFVERDRLQSGSSDAVLVVETDIKGGTMHAANSIIELDRILAVFNHPEKFSYDNVKSNGNKILIKEKQGIPVFSEEELKTLISRVYNNSNAFYEKNRLDESKRKLQNHKQISFDI